MPWWRSRWSRRVTLQERADEMRAHLDLYADELMARGWSVADAQREARLKFGNPRAKLEEVAALDVWRHGGNVLRHDIRHALRFFRRRSGFTLTVVLTLAVGLGVTTAVYSIYSAVLLKPLPFDAPERLVAIVIQDPSGATTGLAGGSLAAVNALPAVARVAAHVGAEAPLLGQGTPEVLRGALVTRDFFAVFGVPAALGRTLVASDTDSASPVVLSHRTWQRRFGADPAVIGRAVRLGDVVHSVVGVMPSSFRYPDDAAFWQLYRVRGTELARFGPGPFTVVARLTSADAASVASQAAVLRVSGPGEPRTDARLTAVPLIEFMAAQYRAPLRLLCGAVGLVLLLSCVNVAGLLFASITSRDQEFAIRGAIGASRQRLVRQLLVEAIVLTAAGAAVGVTLSGLIISALPMIGTLDIPRLDDVAIDWRVVLFAVAAAGASVCLVGIGPALYGARRARSIANAGRGVVGPRTRTGHTALIVLQIAATLTLAVGSGLALASLYRLQTLNPGFEAQGLTITSIRPAASAPAGRDAQAAYSHILARLREESAFDAVATMSHVPLEPQLPTAAGVTSAQGVGVPPGRGGARLRVVSAGAFHALGVPMITGRDFAPDDREGGPLVAIVNETLARKLWGSRDAVGESLVIDARPASRAAYRVVGVSQDFRASLRRAPQPEVYVASTQVPSPMKFVVRSALPLEDVTARVRQVVLAEDPTLPVTDVVTVRGLMWEATVFERFHAVLLSAFGLCAALIAVSGIAAVIMYAVAGRTREIGIRLAVGATPQQVIRLLVGEITPALTLGLTAGLFAIYNLAYLLQQQGLLFEVSVFHPGIYAGVTLALFLVGIVAAWVPARRAGRIEPTVALRSSS